MTGTGWAWTRCQSRPVWKRWRGRIGQNWGLRQKGLVNPDIEESEKGSKGELEGSHTELGNKSIHFWLVWTKMGMLFFWVSRPEGLKLVQRGASRIWGLCTRKLISTNVAGFCFNCYQGALSCEEENLYHEELKSLAPCRITNIFSKSKIIYWVKRSSFLKMSKMLPQMPWVECVKHLS